MSVYEQFEKIYCGTWKHDRDENLEAILDHLKTPDEDKKMSMDMKPTLTLKRSGDSIVQTYSLGPNFTMESTIIFGQEYELKDPAEPKKWHSKSMPTFDGKEFKQVFTALMPPPKNIDYESIISVSGDEMTHQLSGVNDNSVVGKRIFKRV